MFGKQDKAVQGIGKGSASPLFTLGIDPAATRLMARMIVETDARMKSAFPMFERFQDVRATPDFSEGIVKDILVRKGLDPYIRAKLEGKPLVDLCCGDEISVAASKGIAAHYGARLEVVDLHLPESLIGVQMGIKGTRMDALTYVLSLPDNYANFITIR